METDIFPCPSGLVARPDTGIALCTGPTVQGDDERTGIVAIICHNLRHVRNAVQSERISGSYPGNIGFQHTYTCVTHFLDDITLQQGTDTFFGMQVRLCPQTYFHTVFVGIVRQVLQIADITVQGLRLAVAGSITIIGQQPAQRHIMIFITVYHSACRELIIILFPVQRFFDTAIVFLAFLITLSVLKQDTIFIFFPIVTVISIQMPLIKTELRYQYRMACQLIVIIQQRYGTLIYHNEDIQIIGLMGQLHDAFFLTSEVIDTSFKSVPHYTVSVC